MLINTHSFFRGRLFSRKKTPGGHAGGLAKWGGITKIGFAYPKSQNVVWKPTGASKEVFRPEIPKCHLETCWANKDVCTCAKFQNVVELPIELPTVLAIVLPIVLAIVKAIY